MTEGIDSIILEQLERFLTGRDRTGRDLKSRAHRVSQGEPAESACRSGEDMACAGLRALLAPPLPRRWHDRQLMSIKAAAPLRAG